jgi:hypothetical protein
VPGTVPVFETTSTVGTLFNKHNEVLYMQEKPQMIKSECTQLPVDSFKLRVSVNSVISEYSQNFSANSRIKSTPIIKPNIRIRGIQELNSEPIFFSPCSCF